MNQVLMIRLKSGAGLALAMIVALIVADLVFIFDEEYILNISELSTAKCNYTWQLLLTNMAVNLLCIIPFSILLTPLKLEDKTQGWIIMVTSCVIIFFAGLTNGLMKTECQDYYAYNSWILWNYITMIIPSFIVVIGTIFIIIHLIERYCLCSCDWYCSCDSCTRCMEDYELCCNTCCKKYEEQEVSV